MSSYPLAACCKFRSIISRSASGIGTSAITAASLIMSTVIFFGSPSAMAQSTPGKSVPASPSFEHAARKLRRFTAGMCLAIGILAGLGGIRAKNIRANGQNLLVDPGAFSNRASRESSATHSNFPRGDFFLLHFEGQRHSLLLPRGVFRGQRVLRGFLR